MDIAFETILYHSYKVVQRQHAVIQHIIMVVIASINKKQPYHLLKTHRRVSLYDRCYNITMETY